MSPPAIASDRFINVGIKASTLVDILASYKIHICDLHCVDQADKHALQRLLLQATINNISKL
ncbi:hypothetical protein [Alteromonas sp. ASW11-130]|uniref:hypothetical protein n=1 Tax=Alteromonas sp. ASW11-130 TaxID=3015775 RepID=UPI00224295E6|nr:hypothetical protein [Alteromonas sp. ASW11-130]MCW8093379.1 hypothetical protein [Alteromonas sp. ASW11-130]